MYIVHAICERVVWIVTFFVTRVISSFQVVGQKNLKGVPRPLMIISNHVSFWDPMTIGTLFPFFSRYLPITFMVADEYYRNPILKIFFILTRTLPTHRGEGLDVSLKGPREVLRNKGVFLIFPMGQRHSEDEKPRPKRGAAVLALEMQNELTILPTFIKMPPWGLKRKKISINVGRPFKLREITDSQNVNDIAQILSDEIFGLGEKIIHKEKFARI